MRAGYKMTELGEIPEDWEVKTFDEFAIISMGQSPNGTTYNQSEIGVALINGPTEFTSRYPVKMQWTTSPTKLCKSGDILLCVRGSSTGRINISNDTYCIGRGVAAIRAKSTFDNSLLEYVTNNVVEKILSLTSGSTFPNVDGKSLRNILVPVPTSLLEQQKIAAILSTVDKKIEVIDSQITQTRELKKGLMQKLLTRGIGHTKFQDSVLGEIPESWEVVSADNLGIEFIDGDRGVNYPSSADFSKKGFCLFLSAKNVTKNGFQFEDCQFISKEKDDQLRKGKLSLWDLVITTRGSVGNIALFDDNVAYSNMRLNSGMVIVRDKDQIFDKNYLYQYFKSPLFQNQVETISFGSAQPQLTIKELKKIKLLNLPLNEQLSIAEVLKTIDSKLNVLANKWETYQELKKGLMQQLLTGKVRVVESVAQAV